MDYWGSSTCVILYSSSFISVVSREVCWDRVHVAIANINPSTCHEGHHRDADIPAAGHFAASSRDHWSVIFRQFFICLFVSTLLSNANWGFGSFGKRLFCLFCLSEMWSCWGQGLSEIIYHFDFLSSAQPEKELLASRSGLQGITWLCIRWKGIYSLLTTCM